MLIFGRLQCTGAGKTNHAQYFMMIREWTDISDLNAKLEVLTNQSSYYIAVDGPRNSRGESAKLFPGSMDGWMVTMISKSTKTLNEPSDF